MREVVIHGIYKHFKGNYYLVEDIAKDSETMKDVVVYRQLYGNMLLFTKDVSMFLSEVDHLKYPEIDQKYRFELIESKDKSANLN